MWTRITYDVQGEISSATAYSGGKNNTSQHIAEVYAYDQWNNGPKTRAYYNYATAYVDGNVGKSAGDNMVVIEGGMVELDD